LWQEVFVHLQHICIERVRAKIAETEVKDASVRKLLIFLQQVLSGDTERANTMHGHFKELEPIRRLDIGVNAADREYFSAYTAPLQLRRASGGEEAITITTYAAVAFTILEHVHYTILKPLESVLPDGTPGEADAATLKATCSTCKLVIVRARQRAGCGIVLILPIRNAAWRSGSICKSV
jgi:hypothetical protein